MRSMTSLEEELAFAENRLAAFEAASSPATTVAAALASTNDPCSSIAADFITVKMGWVGLEGSRVASAM